MGFLRDLAKLHKMGNDQLANLDVKGQLGEAQARLDALNATAPTPAALNGLAVTTAATVTATRDTGVIMNGQPTVEVDLMVLLPTGVPVQVTRSLTVSPLHLYRLQPGRQVDVRLDPADPQGSAQIAL